MNDTLDIIQRYPEKHCYPVVVLIYSEWVAFINIIFCSSTYPSPYDPAYKSLIL